MLGKMKNCTAIFHGGSRETIQIPDGPDEFARLATVWHHALTCGDVHLMHMTRMDGTSIITVPEAIIGFDEKVVTIQ